MTEHVICKMGRARVYVAEPGSVKSYTTSIHRARRFPSKEAAERECCGNEFIVPFDQAARSKS